MLREHTLKKLLALAIALPMCCIAYAQEYPSKPVRLVVPTVPGGATDYTARFMAQRLGAALGQSIVVDNKAGADGQIGLEAVAKAAPDGYTLVMPITSFSSNPSIYDKLPFDTLKDFEPVALVSKAPLLVLVNPNVPARNIEELIAFAKSNPGKLNFANSGSGTMSNLAGQMFRKMAGVDIVPIGYKGAGQIMTDLVAGQIQIYFSTIPAAIQLVNAGKLRALGVTSPTRVAELPAVPSVAESGLPGFDVVSWFGVFAPAGTPRPVVDRLNAEIQKILALPETREAFSREGLLPGGGSPQSLRQFLGADIAKWKKIISEAGIKRD
jgi:tripartite-type tricarboxylate transporter receptor subunit TctC